MNHITAYLQEINVDPSQTKLRDLARALERMPANWRAKPDAPRLTRCKCGGTGFFRYDVPFGHPNYGKAEPCGNCNYETRVKEYNAQLSDTERTFTLQNWIGSDENARARAVEAVQKMSGIHCFIGDFGRGKTGLLTAICNATAEQRFPSQYVVANDLLNKLRAAYDPHDLGAFNRAVEQIAQVRVLALDEMWEYKASDWTEQTLRTILDERYRFWDSRLTVIGANRMPEDGAIVSRLHDAQRSEIVYVTGVDLRPLAAVIQPPAPRHEDDEMDAYADAWALEFDDNFVSVPVSA